MPRSEVNRTPKETRPFRPVSDGRTPKKQAPAHPAAAKAVARAKRTTQPTPTPTPTPTPSSSANTNTNTNTNTNASTKKRPEATHSFMRQLPASRLSATTRGALLANYQPTVTVAIVGAAVCSDELKPPTSSYAKPYDRPLRLWSCQNFEYEFDGVA